MNIFTRQLRNAWKPLISQAMTRNIWAKWINIYSVDSGNRNLSKHYFVKPRLAKCFSRTLWAYEDYLSLNQFYNQKPGPLGLAAKSIYVFYLMLQKAKWDIESSSSNAVWNNFRMHRRGLRGFRQLALVPKPHEGRKSFATIIILPEDEVKTQCSWLH